ncbi:hypothetical protein [Neobacillus cucumis]|uniref:hypothetical protein n=1 Tax=Neobacillus cucumis TaxID=1740721 RepID=UPI002E241C28|nr:hypothetical protein [Neobacillus cucumis]
MSQPSYLNIDNECFYIENTAQTYFGIQNGYLDMHSLKYRMFGAVWKPIHSKKFILGYWFADHEKDIYCAIKDAGFIDLIKGQETEINEIYQSIRMEQDKENWSKRSRLHVLSIVKKPWRNLSKGWYVLRSSSDYPMNLTCIQKKRYSIWIEPIQVCEDQNDAIKFLNIINKEHNIHLQYEDLQL